MIASSVVLNGIAHVATFYPQPHVTPTLKNGWTALHFAAVNGHTNAVTALLKSGADIGCEEEVRGCG